MSNEIVIELAGVDVAHPGADEARLVHGVDWRIARGAFWVVGGPPGSGRSTLLTTAAGLTRPGGGTLRFFGRDMASATEAEQIDWRRRIGYVFENGGRLFSHLTVAQNIALPLAYHATGDDAELGAPVADWLARAELTAQAHAMPSQVSPRLQQRASLARALIVPTDVVFVDSPPVSQGAREARWWQDQLRALQARGVTVVVGSNEFAAWLDLAATFALIEDEQFRVLGDAAAVRANRDTAWREFVTVY